ncbi:MAG: ATP-binding cassette domain-containing protein [Hyphomicrobium sp.]|nr:ATP-binding cassette domain-containing protein [Hyphomicrobium sp.]
MLRVDTLRLAPLPSLTFQVADGECLTVEGASGSGKTRLLRAIADLDPVEGLIFLDGAERHEITGPQWRARVRYVAAESGWWSDTPRGTFPRDAVDAERLERQLANVGLTPEHLDRDIGHLSTGERARLAFVRALQGEPKVLLLDEPTAALDPASAALVEEQIRFQLYAGRIVVLATHDVGLSQRVSHTRLMLPKPRAATLQPTGGPA